METLVLEQLESIIDSLECCKCDKCISDIVAYTLNTLPQKYVTSNSGELYSKLNAVETQFGTAIIASLIKASKIVGENPNH